MNDHQTDPLMHLRENLDDVALAARQLSEQCSAMAQSAQRHVVQRDMHIYEAFAYGVAAMCENVMRDHEHMGPYVSDTEHELLRRMGVLDRLGPGAPVPYCVEPDVDEVPEYLRDLLPVGRILPEPEPEPGRPVLQCMSDAGVAFLAEVEGRKRYRYRDANGAWTIGVGHLIREDGSDDWMAEQGWVLSDSQVDKLLAEDVRWAEAAVRDGLGLLPQHRFDALCSFTFNVGPGAWQNSTLRRVVHTVTDETELRQQVAAQLRRWVYSGGERVSGLVNRRENEVVLFCDGDYTVRWVYA